jgi:hypothetical protein
MTSHITGAAIRSGGDLAAKELAALQALTNALGSGFWLNTIVAVTHAGVCVCVCSGTGKAGMRLSSPGVHASHVQLDIFN